MIHCTTDTAVVVLSYNGSALHQDFFPLLVAESIGKYDVVLIDNASTDNTLAYVQVNFPTVKTYRIEVNKGFANGYFLGLQQVQAKYYVLLSADFEVTPNWFMPMHSLMENNAKISACQPKIKYYRDKKMFEYAGAGGGFIDKWGYLFCRGRLFFTLEEDTHQYDNNIEVFWAGGGCMMVRSNVYHQLGGLDADLYAHMEEVDLCWRMQNHGHTIAYCGNSTVYHIGGSVISYGSPQKLYYNYRNSLVLLLKNVPLAKLITLLPWRMLLDVVSAFKALSEGKFIDFATIAKAHFHFITHLRFWYKKRKLYYKTPIPNTLQTSDVVYKKSTIAQYFLKHKTKFTDLDFGVKEIKG